MNDITSRLSEQELAELCALADGTLPPERRAAVEARVAASPELRGLVDRQRRALEAVRTLESEPVPEPLKAAVETRRRTRESERGRTWRLAPRFGVAAALAIVVAIVTFALIGGNGGPTVAEAAELADRPPSGPAPTPRRERGTQLALDVEGVAFPNLQRSFDWRATGVHHDEVDGRSATAVFYADGARRIAYVIVAGPALPRPSDAPERRYRGITFHTLRVDGRRGVTWRRAGRTCILIGAASPAELFALASWPGAR